MRLGVVFPQTEIGADPGAIRAYVAAVAEAGYDHLLAYDHVVGADPAIHEGWRGPYDISSTFHEPFVLFGYLAAIATLELVTGIIILPQRQTVLVAKQAAEVDLLTGGKLRLGVGIGWNAVEYEALGQDFSNRGKRLGEQITVMRRLWTEPSVSFTGDYATLTGAGIAPLPVQRPIPVWFGASSPPALRRAGTMGDGWFPMMAPGAKLDDAIAVVHDAARAAGRDPGGLGMEGRIDFLDSAGPGGDDQLVAKAAGWRAAGATHLSLNTMRAGLATVDDHIKAVTTAFGSLVA
jgi:probable F420-dependent oxidoreductase